MTKGLAFFIALALLACSSQQTASRVAEPLDPEAYRPHLVLLDAIIFEDVSLTPEAHQMLSESVGRLARELALEGDHPETAAALKGELDHLGRTVQEATGKPMENSGVREEWLRIRHRFFEDADWFRASPSDPVADLGPAPRMGEDGRILQDVPGMDTLSEVFTTLFIIAQAAERDLGRKREVTPARAQMLSLLTSQLARVDSILAARTDFSGDEHFRTGWVKAREASRQLKIFIAADADTLPGSPGRAALEGAVKHLSDGMEELEKVGS